MKSLLNLHAGLRLTVGLALAWGGLLAAPSRAALGSATSIRNLQDVSITGLSANSSSPTVLGRTTYLTATTVTGDNIVYTWNFGDGSTGSGATTSRVYAQTGTYTVIVTATNAANSQVASRAVTVTNTRPNAHAGFDQNRQVTGTITLLANQSNDPDGHYPLEYRWRQTGGPPVVLDFYDVVPPTFIAPSTPTVLTFTMRVTDSRGLPSLTADEVVITFRDIEISGLNASNNSPNIVGTTTLFSATVLAGSNVSYAWNFGDGTFGSGPAPARLYANTGFYDAVVTATNSEGSVTATTRVSITNGTPYANGGPDRDVFVSTLTTLNGTPSVDPDGHYPLTYSWKQTGGPLRALSNASSAIATFTTPAVPAVLTYTLTVTDARGLVTIGPDDVVINTVDVPISGLSVRNSSPTVLGLTTFFTATIGGGSNVIYTWDFGNGQGANGATVSMTYASTGLYSVTLNAFNGTNIVRNTFPVTITNARPIANAGLDQNVSVGSVVLLNGSASFDPDNHMPLQYRWTQSAGSLVTLLTPGGMTTTLQTPSTPTILVLSLAVTDARGLVNTTPDVVQIVVGDVPVTGLSGTHDGPKTLGSAIAFTGSVTGGTNVRYFWSFGDGGNAGGITSTHTYAAPGTYTVTLTADNAAGAVSMTLPVTIWPIPIASIASVALSTRENDGTVPVVVALDRASSNPVTMTLTPAQDTAAAPGDYAGQPIVRVLPAGTLSATVAFAITNDALHESTEAFSVTLAAVQNAQLGAPSAVQITINDDDPPPTIRFESGYYTATENAGSVMLFVLLDTPSALVTQVAYGVDASASNAAAAGVLTFSPGEVRKSLVVTLLDDVSVENDVVTLAQLSAPVNGSIGTPASARLTVLDDESPPIVRFTVVSGTVFVGERVTATIRLDRASTLLATVLVESNGEARTLTFMPGTQEALYVFTAPNTPNSTVTLQLDLPLTTQANARLATDGNIAIYRVIQRGFKVMLPLMNRK